MATWYRRTYGRGRRCLVPVCRVRVPENYAAMVIGLRRRLGLSQQQLAIRVGAANKAVVYQGSIPYLLKVSLDKSASIL